MATFPADPTLNSTTEGTAPGSPSSRALWPFVLICAQIVLALAVLQRYRLESRTFFYVAALIAVGFVVHAILPLRLREGFFACISLGTIVVVFGPVTAAKIALIGSALIGICHLPVALRVRVAVLVAAGAALMAVRGDALRWLHGTEVMPSAAWAILGSMFMFRLAVYLHSLETRSPDDPPPTIARSVAYFFMAPNTSFPLYPVIDYNRFAANHYDRPDVVIYQTGTQWIARGLLHLVLYRLVYLHVANDPKMLANLGDLLQFILATYMLYLRVSGTFHLIVGVLHLFGYRLPETHHLYYLADSFNDYWRRINIYWKDFMMKLVYYPSFFRLRKVTKGNNAPALVVATGLVFASTWVLHSYQWFWLNGGFPIKAPDLLFWSILGALVIRNALRDTKQPRKRIVQDAGWSWRRALKVMGVFWTICILWSLWSAESVMDWIIMWRAAAFADARDIALLAGLLALGFAIAGRRWDTGAEDREEKQWHRSTNVATTVTLVGLLALTFPPVQHVFGEAGSAFLASLQSPRLNARDSGRRINGYYEKMDVGARQANQPWEEVPTMPAGSPRFIDTPGYRARKDFLANDNMPSTRFMFLNNEMAFNRFGLRGAEIDSVKPPKTVRVAVIGPSYVFAYALPDSSTIPSLLAGILNREKPNGPDVRYEVLNFGVSGNSMTQVLAMLDDRAVGLSPDIVVIGLDNLAHNFVEHLTEVVRTGVHVPYPGLAQLLTENGLELGEQRGFPVPFGVARSLARKAGMTVRVPRGEIEQRIMMATDTLSRWVVGEIARTTRAHGAIPVAMIIDLVNDQPVVTPAPFARILDAAEKSGFLMADTRDVYLQSGLPLSELAVSDWDVHPSAKANALIAERLWNHLKQSNIFAKIQPR